jgi:hypothetical protein
MYIELPMLASCFGGGKEEKYRTAKINAQQDRGVIFSDNTVTTSKYTLISFIPVTLFEQ